MKLLISLSCLLTSQHLIESFSPQQNFNCHKYLLSSITSGTDSVAPAPPNRRGAITLDVEELSELMGGWGRARLAWDFYRLGIDPLVYFSEQLNNNNDVHLSMLLNVSDTEKNDVRNLLPSSRSSQDLGRKALDILSQSYADYGGKLEGGVVNLSHISASRDGTTKLLIRLFSGFEVETVIIPWQEKGWSTLCISSQVGCKQACTFCATGKMGELRSLSAEEILGQFFIALKICRLNKIPPISNVVFMGMGEPAANAIEVKKALKILTDVDLFHQGQTKVIVSTVAPSPEAFTIFQDSPCVLAWSVHAANDGLRKQLVPTTKYKMDELRDGLISALMSRPKRFRTTMLEVTLIDGINDSLKCAEEMANFTQTIIDSVPDVKVVVNLIPFNDIGHHTYRRPSVESVNKFQKILRERRINAHVRTTRGDDESAACGMLSTKKTKNRNFD